MTVHTTYITPWAITGDRAIDINYQQYRRTRFIITLEVEHKSCHCVCLRVYSTNKGDIVTVKMKLHNGSIQMDETKMHNLLQGLYPGANMEMQDSY